MKASYYKVAGVLAVLVSLGACQKNDDQHQTKSSNQAMAVPTVDVQVVELFDVPIITTASGRTAAFELSQVRPQVSGMVEEVLFQEGTMVEAGQPLYRINVDDYMGSVASAEAAFHQAKAQADTARVDVLGKQARLEQAQADLARLEELIKIDAISRQMYDQAITAFKSAQVALEQAHATLAGAEAMVHSAQTQIQNSQLTLSRTVIKAPIAGKIGISAVSKGALVSAGQAEALVTIARYDPIYVDIYQSSADLIRLREALLSGAADMGSAEVMLKLANGSIYPLRGQLVMANAQVSDTGAVTLRAIVPNPEGVLLPNMLVDAYIEQKTLPNATLVPATALSHTPKGEAWVYVVDNDKKIEQRFVLTAGTQDGQWVISDGLKAGERVVVLDTHRLQPKQAVDVRHLPAPHTPSNLTPLMPSSQPSMPLAAPPMPSPQAGQHSVLAPKPPKATSPVSDLEQEMMDMADDSQ